jgi:competence protein ComEA
MLAVAGMTDKFTTADGSLRAPCDRVLKFDAASQFFTVERIPGALLVAASRRIDVNSADESDLLAVPGIGPRTAEKIIRHREQAGAFSCLDDLLRIPGIGKKKLATMATYLEIRGSDPVQGIQDADTR